MVVEFDVTDKGRIENCRVVTSSGSPSLDNASCQTIVKGPGYLAAMDESGKKVRAAVRRRVVWALPR